MTSDLPSKVAVLETKVEKLEYSMDHLSDVLEKTNEKLEKLVSVIAEAAGGRKAIVQLSVLVGAPALIAAVVMAVAHRIWP